MTQEVKESYTTTQQEYKEARQYKVRTHGSNQSQIGELLNQYDIQKPEVKEQKKEVQIKEEEQPQQQQMQKSRKFESQISLNQQEIIDSEMEKVRNRQVQQSKGGAETFNTEIQDADELKLKSTNGQQKSVLVSNGFVEFESDTVKVPQQRPNQKTYTSSIKDLLV